MLSRSDPRTRGATLVSSYPHSDFAHHDNIADRALTQYRVQQLSKAIKVLLRLVPSPWQQWRGERIYALEFVQQIPNEVLVNLVTQ